MQKEYLIQWGFKLRLNKVKAAGDASIFQLDQKLEKNQAQIRQGHLIKIGVHMSTYFVVNH